jgi:hypothetical protein
VYPGLIKLPPVDSNPELPEPSATGSFAKTPLSHLLVYAHDRELTGTFEFSGPTGQTATVLFIEGQPTKARAADAKIYLGRVLFELGILGDEQLALLLPRLLGSTELHGQVLISEGVITEEQLELALRAQLVRQMKWLVHLPSETTYKYYDCFDGLAAYGGDGHVGIDPFPVVWACIRDEPPWEHVHVGLTRIGSAGLRLSAAAETLRFSFDKAERATVELLRQKPWRIHELTSIGTMPPRLVQVLLYCLLVTKQVELVRESKIPGASPSAEDDEPIPDAPPSSPFSGSLVNVPPLPRTVARVQLAQRPATRSNMAVEEHSSAGRLTPEGDDGGPLARGSFAPALRTPRPRAPQPIRPRPSRYRPHRRLRSRSIPPRSRALKPRRTSPRSRRRPSGSRPSPTRPRTRGRCHRPLRVVRHRSPRSTHARPCRSLRP